MARDTWAIMMLLVVGALTGCGHNHRSLHIVTIYHSPIDPPEAQKAIPQRKEARSGNANSPAPSRSAPATPGAVPPNTTRSATGSGGLFMAILAGVIANVITAALFTAWAIRSGLAGAIVVWMKRFCSMLLYLGKYGKLPDRPVPCGSYRLVYDEIPHRRTAIAA